MSRNSSAVFRKQIQDVKIDGFSFPSIRSVFVVTMINSLLNTKERYRHQIQYTSVPYYSLYGDRISKQFNHPFQNGGHKTKFLRALLKAKSKK